MQSLFLSPYYILNCIYGQVQINSEVLGMEPKLISNACPALLKQNQEYLFRLQLFPTCSFILPLLSHRTTVSKLLCHYPLHAWKVSILILLVTFSSLGLPYHCVFWDHFKKNISRRMIKNESRYLAHLSSTLVAATKCSELLKAGVNVGHNHPAWIFPPKFQIQIIVWSGSILIRWKTKKKFVVASMKLRKTYSAILRLSKTIVKKAQNGKPLWSALFRLCTSFKKKKKREFKVYIL